MTFDLTGLVVREVRLDGTVLHLSLGDWSLTIENDYSFGDLRTPTDEPAIVELLASAVGTALASFDYTSDGQLSVGLAGDVLHVAPCDRFESWVLVGPHQERVVCTPGGSLAIWS